MVSTHKYTIVLVLIGWNALVVVAGSSLLSQPEIEVTKLTNIEFFTY